MFLDPTVTVLNNPEPEQLDFTSKRPGISSPISSSTAEAALEPQTFSADAEFGQAEPRGLDSQMTILPPFAGYSESDFERVSESESDQYVGSTLADALKTTPHCLLPETSDQSSVVSPASSPAVPRQFPLGGRSGAMIKEHFEKSERFRLPAGHPIVAFTESQISTVLRVVAAGTARAFNDVLENLVYGASRLSLVTWPGGNQANEKGPTRRCPP